MRLRTVGLALATSVLLAGAAQAHTHLVASAPAAGAVVAAPASLTLTFSERLEPKFSKVSLARADGTTVALSSTVAGKDRKAVVGKPSKALAPGAYKVTWQAVGGDGHKMTGDYAFTVK